MSYLTDLTPAIRVALIVVVAVLGHFLVQITRSFAERILARAGDPTLAAKVAVAKRYPKFATITSLVVSALTFFRQRVLAAMKELDPEYPEWMVSVTYRVE